VEVVREREGRDRGKNRGMKKERRDRIDRGEKGTEEKGEVESTRGVCREE